MSGPLPRPGDISLLLLADILEHADERHEAAREPLYDQTTWDHPCGTPACAIGHWLAQEGRKHYRPTEYDLNHRLPALFELGSKQWAYLFGYPPGYPRTAKEAAERIRAFVAERLALTVGEAQT